MIVTIKKSSNLYSVKLKSIDLEDYSGRYRFGENSVLLGLKKEILYLNGYQLINENAYDSKRQILSLKQFKDKVHYSNFLISESSPEKNNTILFVDRRLIPIESAQENSCGDGEPPMLYPDNDPTSGFYLVDFSEKTLKKLCIQGDFVGWVSDSLGIVTDKLPFSSSPNYFVINVQKNIITKKITLPPNFRIIDNTSSKNLIVEYSHSKLFEVQFGILDTSSYRITPLTQWFPAHFSNLAKVSPYDKKTYSIYSHGEKGKKDIFWINYIFTNGIPYVTFTTNFPICDYSWFSENELVFSTFENELVIFDTNLKKKVFEIQSNQ